MNRRRSITLLAVAVLVVATISFVTGRLLASRRQTDRESAGWLGGAPAGVQEAEQQFEEEVQALRETVLAQKSDLAAMLADPCSLDEHILAQVHRVVESHTVLMQAVGSHLVELRHSLPPQQSQRLMRSCADSLQGQVQRRSRWRGGAQDDAGRSGRGYGYGGGRGRGGYGPGGRPYRGGRSGSDNLADRLQLTAEQVAFAQAHDPNFATDTAGLKQGVVEACNSLLAGFQDAQIDNAELLQRLNSLIEAHNRLELRVAQYVLMIRSELSAAQRQRLAGFSRGGYRYRGGRSMSTGPGPVGMLGTAGCFGQIIAEAF